MRQKYKTLDDLNKAKNIIRERHLKLCSHIETAKAYI